MREAFPLGSASFFCVDRRPSTDDRLFKGLKAPIVLIAPPAKRHKGLVVCKK